MKKLQPLIYGLLILLGILIGVYNRPINTTTKGNKINGILEMIENHYVDQEYKIKWEKFYNSKIMNEHQFYPLRNKLETLLLKNKNKYRLCIIPQK